MEDVEVVHPSRFHIRTLAVLGLWMLKDANKQFVYRIYGVALHLIFSLAFTLAMIINLAAIKNLDDITESLYMTLTECAMCVKVFNIILRGKQVSFVMDAVLDGQFSLRTEEEAKQFKRNYEQFNRIRKVYLAICLTCIFSGFLMPVFATERKYPYPAWFPFDWRSSVKVYSAIYAYEVVSMTINCVSNATLDLFQAYLMFQVGMFYELIGFRFRNLAAAYEDNDISSEFVEIVKMHQTVHKLTKIVEKIISFPTFIQFNLSSIVICFSLFQLKNISPLENSGAFIMHLTYIAAMIFQIFLSCYYGNTLMERSGSLIDAIYHSKWVNQSLQFKKLIFVYMESLKKSHQIKVFGLFLVGLDIFAMIINTSYRLFAVLLNFDE